MTKDSKLVRLRNSTIARLEEYRRRCETLDEQGRGPNLESGAPGGGPAGLDALICRLLDEPVIHRRRAAQAREKARAERAARAGGEPPADHSQSPQ